MGKIPGINHLHAIRALEKAGFRVVREGKHTVMSDGARIRVAEKGYAGERGAGAGDLLMLVQVEPHGTFHREGDDVHISVSIGVHEAALGAKIEVPAPDGTARLRVPPGTQSGQRFRVRGRGAPSPRTGERGDLVAEVRIVLPRVLDERSKELLREFGLIIEMELMSKVEGRD